MRGFSCRYASVRLHSTVEQTHTRLADFTGYGLLAAHTLSSSASIKVLADDHVWAAAVTMDGQHLVCSLMTCLVGDNMQVPTSHTSLPSCFGTSHKPDHAAGKLLGFEFQRDAVMLASSPFPELEDCMGTALSPEKLLQQLTCRGLPLLVPPAAVAAAGLTCKVRPETTDKHRCQPPSVNQPV